MEKNKILFIYHIYLGGMETIVNQAINYYRHNPNVFFVLIVDPKIKILKDERIHLIEINSHYLKNEPFILESFHQYMQTIPYHFFSHIIFDVFTYKLAQKFEAKKIFDMHTLCARLQELSWDLNLIRQLDIYFPIEDEDKTVLLQYSLHLLARENKAVIHSDIIIVNSDSSKKDFLRFYSPTSRPHLVTIRPSSENLEVNIVENSSNPWHVCLSGRPNIQKGLPNVLKNNSEYILNVCGIEQVPVVQSDNIIFHGYRSREYVMNLIQTCHFALFPSIYEPWGLSLTEALSLGKICLVQKNSGGPEEQIIHGENGFIVNFKENNWWDLIEEIKEKYTSQFEQISRMAKQSVRPWQERWKSIDVLLS